MIRNIQETFLPKTGMQKSPILQDPGYMLHAMIQGAIPISFPIGFTVYIDTVDTGFELQCVS